MKNRRRRQPPSPHPVDRVKNRSSATCYGRAFQFVKSLNNDQENDSIACNIFLKKIGCHAYGNEAILVATSYHRKSLKESFSVIRCAISTTKCLQFFTPSIITRAR